MTHPSAPGVLRRGCAARPMASHADAQQGACVGGRMTACCDGVCECLLACGHRHAPAARVAQMRSRAQRRGAVSLRDLGVLLWCGAHIWSPDGLRCVGMLAVLARAHSPEGSADSTGRLPLSVRIRRAVAQADCFLCSKPTQNACMRSLPRGRQCSSRITSRGQKLAQIMPARLSCAGLPLLWRA